MEQRIDIPWKSWHADETRTLTFPADWTVTRCPIADAPALDATQIAAAIRRPIHSPSLRELAHGRRDAVIVVDDISRPTKCADVLAPVLDELAAGGIPRDRIRILIALGAHRPMVKREIVWKVGEAVYQTVDVMNHNPYDNLVDLGRSRIGTPIRINRFYCEADLKLSLSCIEPHEWAGFGGGAKNILPGVSGIDTLEANHSMLFDSFQALTGRLEGNPLRADIEEIARTVGLDAIVNVVTNAARDTAGVFMGDMIAAHRAGVAFARRVYATTAVTGQDVGVFNAYPKDTEILQFSNALNIAASTQPPVVREGGTVVVASACTEGRGHHGLCGQGARLATSPEHVAQLFSGRRAILFSPGLSPKDAYSCLPADVPLCHRWPEVIRHIQSHAPGPLRAAVFPTGPLHLPAAAE